MNVIWTTILWDNLWDNKNISKNVCFGIKTKRKWEHDVSMREEVVTKIIIKSLFKYHFSKKKVVKDRFLIENWE